MKLVILFLSMFCLPFNIVLAQTPETVPEIGQPCPSFYFTDVRYFLKKATGLKDFRGKWLILDFWSKTCVSCVQSFPKINKLQKQFRNEVQFLLVGINSQYWNHGIDDMYEKFRKKYHLDLAVAYDSVVYKKYGITGVPTIIIIDPDGIIRSINLSSELNEISLRELINNPKIKVASYLKMSKDSLGNSGKKLLFLHDDDEKPTPSLIYKSVLGICNKNESVGSYFGYDKGYFQLGCVSLSSLYQQAYFPRINNYSIVGPGDSLYSDVWPKLILEIADSSLFNENPVEPDFYTYSLSVPKPKDESFISRMTRLMQDDLKRFFGYDVVIRKQLMPCWNLFSIPSAKKGLQTKGGTPFLSGDQGGYKFTNMSVNSILGVIDYNISQEVSGGAPFVDLTGIKENVDLDLNAIMTDLTDIKRELSKVGLHLVKGERLMKCIVIRDPQYNK